MLELNVIKKYLNSISPIPDFLTKYLSLDILQRLKNIGYFCGMDFASKDVYPFSFYISRYDHSLSTALIVWKHTKSEKQTISALFHDISTPCFSHVIDYMNGDYQKQESTEEKTVEILSSNTSLKELLEQDSLTIDDIICFKDYPIVDNSRPKLCADRLDGIILTSFAWTKKLDISEVDNILKTVSIFNNEDNEPELGFLNLSIAEKMVELNNLIDIYCHSNSDNYMMHLLADITLYAIDTELISYDDLYLYNEKDLWDKFELFAKEDSKFSNLLTTFKTILDKDIPLIELPPIKKRVMNPIVNGKRLKN